MAAHDLQSLEKKLAVLAYIVLRHGEAYVPLLDRLEEEIEEVRKRGSYRDRAQQILRNSLSVEGTVAQAV